MRLDKPIGFCCCCGPRCGGNGWPATAAGLADPVDFRQGVVLMRSAGCVITTMPTRLRPARGRTRERPLAAARCRRKKRCYWRRACPAGISADFLPLNIWYWGCRSSRCFWPQAIPSPSVSLRFRRLVSASPSGFGIPMSYAALWGAVPLEAGFCWRPNTFWAIAYDTEYALVDRADDLKIGIKTSAITFGRLICRHCRGYAATLGCSDGVGLQREMGVAFSAGWR